jgi:hypothetical protein
MIARALRLAVAGSLGLSLLVGGGAVAAPTKAKPVCNLITDPAGDTTGPSTALDIVSGDVASHAKTFTAVIRLAALAETDLSSPTGIAWGLRFVSPKSDLPYYLLASKFQGEDVVFSYGQVDGTSLNELGVAKGVIDVAEKEVRIHAPVKALGLKPGTEITGLQAQGRRAIGTNGAALYMDADSSNAAASEDYTTSTPSCVKPGA